MFKKFFGWIFGGEEIKYPSDFGIITFTAPALEGGFSDNRNKVILRYFINKFGNLEEKRYRFSEERVFALQTIHKVPIFDKTKKEAILPVFSRVSPSEIKFMQER